MLKPYLNFSGDCAAAFELYKNAFGGEIVYMQKYGELPTQTDEKVKDWVMHAQLSIPPEGAIMGADAIWEFERGSAINLSVELPDAQSVETAWAVLKDGASIIADLAPTPPPYVGLSGTLKDKFGFTWVLTEASY